MSLRRSGWPWRRLLGTITTKTLPLPGGSINPSLPWQRLACLNEVMANPLPMPSRESLWLSETRVQDFELPRISTIPQRRSQSAPGRSIIANSFQHSAFTLTASPRKLDHAFCARYQAWVRYVCHPPTSLINSLSLFFTDFLLERGEVFLQSSHAHHHHTPGST